MEKVTVDELIKLNKEDLYGKIICFPTDTVYGVGALANDESAIKKIYKMKNRSDNKPLPILCSKVSQVEEYAYISKKARTLMEKYWPGALTIILNKKEGAFDNIAEATLAFRMPDSSVSLKIIDHFSLLATTSVNTSGEKELNSVSEIEEKFSSYIDYLVIDSATFSSVASTIVDATSDTLKVIRQGNIVINEI